LRRIQHVSNALGDTPEQMNDDATTPLVVDAYIATGRAQSALDRLNSIFKLMRHRIHGLHFVILDLEAYLYHYRIIDARCKNTRVFTVGGSEFELKKPAKAPMNERLDWGELCRGFQTLTPWGEIPLIAFVGDDGAVISMPGYFGADQISKSTRPCLVMAAGATAHARVALTRRADRALDPVRARFARQGNSDREIVVGDVMDMPAGERR